MLTPETPPAPRLDTSAVQSPPSSALTCWVCGSADVALWKPRSIQRPLVPDDLAVTDSRYGETLTLWHCEACGFIFADADELNQLTELYAQLSDSVYQETQDTRALQMRRILHRALAARPNARTVLDIGAGAGMLLVEAGRAGLDAVGVEPSRDFVRHARAAHAVHIEQGTFPHPALAGRTFDLVFLVDVIEHVRRPVELLRAAADAVAPGGALVVITPDMASYFARRLRERWWHFRLAHVGYFSGRSLAKAARSAGLVVERQGRAKWYFRIDYLAERLAVYLPLLAAINRAARRLAPLRWLYDRVVTIDLHDSLFVVFRRADDRAPAVAPARAAGESAESRSHARAKGSQQGETYGS
jgi:2-polyprenyl-3-methyl-5-hydroxy-6-metoxy-1,4-benzoquinol methylase